MADPGGIPADRANAQPTREPTPSSPRWWWNNVTKAILALGALASAIGAIISLWPDPPPIHEADVEVISLAPMPITEYQQRVPVIKGFVGLPEELPPPPATHGTASSAPAESASTGQAVPSSDSPPPSGQSSDSPPPSGQSSSVTPAPNASPASGTAKVTGASLQTFEKVEEKVEDEAPNFDVVPQSAPTTSSSGLPAVSKGILPTDPDGNVVTSAEAAERVVAVLKRARVRGRPGGKVEPLGVRVSADLRLEGLRGEQLRLSWSVLQRSGKT